MGATAAIVGGTVLGGLFSSRAASKAADAQSRAAEQGANAQADATRYSAELGKQASDEALALQQYMYDQTREDQMPWLEAGQWALGEMQSGIKAGIFDPGKFEFEFSQNDPSYQWRFSEGERAANNTAAARQGLLSGRALKEATRWGQGMASQEYQNEFNRDLASYSTNAQRLRDNYNRLAGLAGTGQTTAANLGTVGMNTAANQGNILIGNAENQGNLAMNQANAFASMYNTQGNAQANKAVANANAFNNALNTGMFLYGAKQGWFS